MSKKESLIRRLPKEETPVDIVKKRLKPMKDLTQLKKELIEWLEKNPLLFIPQHEKGHVILTLSLIIDKIHEYGKIEKGHEANEHQLQDSN